MTANEFIEYANKMRRANKGKWYQLQGVVEGKFVSAKAYGTWVQRMKIQDTPYILDGPMDCSVQAFKKFLREVLGKYT